MVGRILVWEDFLGGEARSEAKTFGASLSLGGFQFGRIFVWEDFGLGHHTLQAHMEGIWQFFLAPKVSSNRVKPVFLA